LYPKSNRNGRWASDAHANADRVGSVVVMHCESCPNAAPENKFAGGLVKRPCWEHFLRTSKHVAHILKKSEAMLSFKYGTRTLGKRISRLLRTKALPPTGYP